MRYNEKEILFKNTSVKFSYVSFNPGTRLKNTNYHSAIEIMYIKTGGGIYSIGTDRIPFQKNDILFFGSNIQHCIIEIYDGEPLECISLKFQPCLLWMGQDTSYYIKFILLYTKYKNEVSNLLSIAHPLHGKIQKLILDIENEFISNSQSRDLMIRLNLLTITLYIIRVYENILKNDDIEISITQLQCLECAIEYIENNWNKNISLELIALNAHMSKTHFCMLFKRFNGVTAWEYLTNKRIDNAINMLIEGKYNRLDIALQCGFNNTTNFYNAFRKVTGMAPREYLSLI